MDKETFCQCVATHKIFIRRRNDRPESRRLFERTNALS